MRVIVVTGPMRSGTSVVARMLCQLGVFMGRTMPMPLGPFDPEYEPAELVAPLAEALANNDLEGAGEVTRRYLTAMRSLMHDAGRYGLQVRAWGLKSPLLAPVLPVIREVLADDDMRLVVCSRPLEDLQQALAKLPVESVITDGVGGRLKIWAMQGRILEALKSAKADLTVPYEATPVWKALQLSGLVHGEPGELNAALRGIREETT